MEKNAPEKKPLHMTLPEGGDIFRTLADESPNMVFINCGGRVAYANRQCEEVLGYTQVEMCSPEFNFMVLIAPEYRDLVRDNYRRRQAGEDIPPCEYVLLTKEGKRLDTIISSKLIPYEDEKAILGVVTDITERKRSERAARHSERLLSSTLQSLDGFLTVIDRDLRVVLSNWKYHDFVTEEERRGKPHCYKIFKHLDAPCEYCPPMETFADGKPRMYEDRNPVDGSFMEIRVTPVFDDSGDVALVMEYLQDITRRKQAEELLRISEEKFSGAFHYSNDAIALCDQDGAILDVNQKALNQFAYSREEITSLTLGDLHHPEEREKSLAALKEAATKGFARFDADYVKKNRKVFPAEVSASLFEVSGKKVVQAIIRDVTKRRRSEEKLKLFRNLIDKSNDALYVIDPETSRFLDVNENSCITLGYGREELLSMKVTDIEASLPDEISWTEHVKKLMERGRIILEGMHTRKDGTTIPVEVNVAHILHNRENYIVAVARDITDRRNLEHELLKAQKIESVGILAGGIAHDFNNLLTGISGNVSLAKEDAGKGSMAYAMLEETEKTIDMTKHLTHQLLTFAKGGIPLKQTLSLPPLLREASRFALSGSNVRMEMAVVDDLWPVEVDEGQIRQVFQNLIMNADQAMPEGGKVACAAENAVIDGRENLPLEDGNYVKMTIRDTGCGIPKEHLSRIFDPYFTTKQKGSGLGLSVCYSIVTKHGGHIAAESQPALGTTFAVYLPASDKGIDDRSGESERLIAGSGRILFMDDEKTVRTAADAMLTRIGYQADFAGDGAEAIELYRKARDSSRPYDAVILDVTVPGGMGGESTIKELLEIDHEVRAIVSSGYSDSPVLSNFREYGFCGFIAKPYNLAQLSRILYEVLRGSR